MSDADRSVAGTAGKVRALGLVLALGLLLTACVHVPDSGSVHAGPEVGSEDEPVLRYAPSGPQPGASQAEIVNGYLDAMRAYPPNPAVVREFLTERATASWSPGARTQIYVERPDLEQVAVDAVRIESDLRAVLSERGAWSTPPAGEQRLRQVLRLDRQRGEWRIANPPPGLLLPEYDFERYYQAYSLYFFDPALRVLVPDQVYLPQGDQTATLLLRGLVRGPTDWLRGAVESMVPPTDFTDLAVPVDDNGVAQVRLGSSARALGAAERDLLAAQLSWTLRQVPDVEAIRVTAGGAPLALEDGSNAVDVDSADHDPADSAAAQALFALRRDHVVAVDTADGLSARVPGLFGTGEVPVSAFAVERSGQVMAVVTDGGGTVEVAPIGADESRVWFDRGGSLAHIQWDIHGLLWAVDRAGPAPALYVMREGRSARVDLRDDPPTDISAFALSRDGLRLAAIEGRGASSRLLVGRVRRPAGDSLELAVDHWREVETAAASLNRFVDVAWAGPTELTVVAEETSGSPQVFTVAVDGSAVEPSALLEVNIVSVADAPAGDLPTVVASRPGTLYVHLSDRWSELALRGVYRQPAYVE